jgi:hypothetical protein
VIRQVFSVGCRERGSWVGLVERTADAITSTSLTYRYPRAQQRTATSSACNPSRTAKADDLSDSFRSGSHPVRRVWRHVAVLVSVVPISMPNEPRSNR